MQPFAVQLCVFGGIARRFLRNRTLIMLIFFAQNVRFTFVSWTQYYTCNLMALINDQMCPSSVLYGNYDISFGIKVGKLSGLPYHWRDKTPFNQTNHSLSFWPQKLKVPPWEPFWYSCSGLARQTPWPKPTTTPFADSLFLRSRTTLTFSLLFSDWVIEICKRHEISAPLISPFAASTPTTSLLHSSC